MTVSDAVQDGRVIGTRDQFFTDTAVYSDAGLEFYEPRKQWYDCKLLTADNSEGRLTCQLEAFGKNFGLNGQVLRQMVFVMQVRRPPLYRIGVVGKSSRYSSCVAQNLHGGVGRQHHLSSVPMHTYAFVAAPASLPCSSRAMFLIYACTL